MTPSVKNLSDLQRHLADGTRQLGALVYWSGLSDVRIARNTFRAEFERMGLGEAVGRDPKAEACLNMAASVAVRRQGKDSQRAKIELKEKGTHAVYAVLMRRDVATVGDVRVRYLEEARVMVDRGQPNPVPQIVTASDVDPGDDARNELITEMVTEYGDIMKNIRTQECSDALIAAMKLLGGLSLRTGVYFVPAANMARLDDLRMFVEAFTNVRITTWAIAANDVNVAQSRRDAHAAFLDQVQEIAEECREFVELKGDDLNAKSINARIKRFQELEGKAELYADILGDRVEELRSVISAARDNFRDAVLG